VRLGPSIRVVLLAVLVYLAPATNARAAEGLSTRVKNPVTLEQGQIPQYQHTNGGQYHGDAARRSQTLAWSLRLRLGNFVLPVANTAPVISLPFSYSSAIPSTNAKLRSLSGSNGSIAVQNNRSIGTRISPQTCSREECVAQVEASRYHDDLPSSRNPRLMLEIGAALGVAYLAFLWVWIWATRLRIQPPRSAGT
jgi:hypothetical protein